MPELFTRETYLTNGVGTISGTITLRSYNSSRTSIMIQNLGTAILYVGGSVVSTSNGLKVLVDGQITLDKSQGAPIYCTCDGTTNVRFLEEII